MNDDDMILPEDFEIEKQQEETLELEPTIKDNDLINVIENDLGQSYDEEEIEYWNKTVDIANQLIEQGHDIQDIEGQLEEVYGEYISQRDIMDFINEGGEASQVSQEAWEMYFENKGKLSIKGCVEATDPFLKGLGEQKKTQRRTKKYKDKFLEGFNSI